MQRCLRQLWLTSARYDLELHVSHIPGSTMSLLIALGGNYMRPGRTQTGMSLYRSPYISFHAFTWDWPKSELRPA